jgi:hypothetical protein
MHLIAKRAGTVMALMLLATTLALAWMLYA